MTLRWAIFLFFHRFPLIYVSHAYMWIYKIKLIFMNFYPQHSVSRFVLSSVRVRTIKNKIKMKKTVTVLWCFFLLLLPMYKFVSFSLKYNINIMKININSI